MAMTIHEFMDYMSEKYPERKLEVKLNRYKLMIELSDTDPGMKDLLDKAEEYYLLKAK